MTNADLYAEKLELFKQKETPEVVLLIADAPELTKIIVAWMSMAVSRNPKRSKLRGDSPHDVWEWLWRNITYSREELMAKSGLFAHRFERKLETLVGNHIIYPDGTINSFMQRYLREKVVKLFGAKPKNTVKKKTWPRSFDCLFRCRFYEECSGAHSNTTRKAVAAYSHRPFVLVQEIDFLLSFSAR